MSFCLIYHAIGTLTNDHFRWSIESLNRQNIHWDDFLLYNHSDRPDDMILHWVDKTKFNSITVFDRKNEIKGAIADWDEQFKRVGNHDFYFVHKADFYLSDGCLEAFEELCVENPLFVGVKKFDMEETVEIPLIRSMAELRSFKMVSGTEGSHPYEPEGEPKWDGVMHGYSDGARQHFNPILQEHKNRFGPCTAFNEMEIRKVTDDRIYAMHMFHELPFDERLRQKQVMGKRY